MISDNIKNFTITEYSFDKEPIHFISASTNEVFMFSKNKVPYIVRYSKRPAEWIDQINAEMKWLYYLANNGISVSLPLYTINGELVTSITDEYENCIISAYEMASGTFWDVNNPDKWNDIIFYNWGKTMAEMHVITKPYEAEIRRDEFKHSWDDNVRACPSVYRIAEEVLAEITNLPRDIDSYGLIHNDLHPWNFYINDDVINVFDFDDSIYGWYALDIGIALYHGLWWGRKGGELSESITKNFMKGYLSVNQLSDYNLSKIPLFMKFRQICKFSWFYDPNNVDEHQLERIRNIENDMLFNDVKLTSEIFMEMIK
jgi:Putative homoserine kinase type II (protein kinase fold)